MLTSQGRSKVKPLRVYGYAGVSTPEQARSEKESIPAQVRDIEAVAARNPSWDLLDVLVVPGFSRNYHQFSKCRDEMADEGIDAFVRLEKLWQSHSIDLMVCRDADRFGRTTAILNTVVGELIDAGARIYLTAKEMYIDEKNYTTLGPLLGFQAADELARIRARHEIGMNGRFLRGISGTHPPFSHILVGKGNDLRLELDESKLAFWKDLADLLLSGVGYNRLGLEMAKRGHRKDGQPYTHRAIWKFLHSPFTWGHVARNYDTKSGAWVYDESLDVPNGVSLRRNAIESVWKGAEAERIKAELSRRSKVAAGRASPESTHRYSGLLVCADCGYRLHYGEAHYYCATRWTRTRKGPCDNTARISEANINSVMLDYLGEVLRRGDIPWTASAKKDTSQQRIADLQRQVERAERQMREMIRQQTAEKHGTVRRIRAEEINGLGNRIDELNAEIARLSKLLEPESIRHQRKVAIDELRKALPAGILARSDREVNQFFYHLLGPLKFVVKDGQIVDLGKSKR